MIPGNLLSACPHRQFHTLPGLFDSRAALSDSYPNALCAKQGGSLYHFMMVFGMTRPGDKLEEDVKNCFSEILKVNVFQDPYLNKITYADPFR